VSRRRRLGSSTSMYNVPRHTPATVASHHHVAKADRDKGTEHKTARHKMADRLHRIRAKEKAAATAHPPPNGSCGSTGTGAHPPPTDSITGSKRAKATVKGDEVSPGVGDGGAEGLSLALSLPGDSTPTTSPSSRAPKPVASWGGVQ
jgi:hypothetical protein